MIKRPLVFCFVFLSSASALAGYANLSPPVGVVTSPTGGSVYTPVGAYAAEKLAEKWIANAKSTSAMLNVGGRQVAVPVTIRLALGASRVAATAAYLAPPVFGALAVGSAAYAAYKYYLDSDFMVEDGKWVQLVKDQSCRPTVSGCLPPSGTGITSSIVPYGSGCATQVMKDGSFIGNWCVGTLSGSNKTIPVTEAEFVNKMGLKPIPDQVIEKFPIPLKLPVDPPWINPDPVEVPSPDRNVVPAFRPLRVPQGEPQPVPNTVPQQYKSPVVDIVPAPTPREPWRVDVQPKDVVSADPKPLPDTAPVPKTPDPTTKVEPKPEVSDLCKQNPDILACQKTKDLSPEPLPEKPKLYEPKYKEGIKGVWDKQKADLKATPLLTLSDRLMPSIPDGGSCPTWNIDFDVGIANYGVKNVAPPCWIWDVAKVIVIFSALLLARALIFGG